MLIRLAEKGDLNAAWLLIDHVAQHLADNADGSEAATQAAAFFEELLDFHDDDRDDRKCLEKSLSKLNLVRRRGRPKGEEFELAWRRVEDILLYLAKRASTSELFAYAARFFQKLVELHNEGADSPKELVSSFETLNLIRARGRPERDSFDIAKLAARVIMLKRKGYAVDAAAILLDDLEIDGKSSSKSGYETAYYNVSRIVDACTADELTVYAGLTSRDLLQLLRKEDRLTPKEIEHLFK